MDTTLATHEQIEEVERHVQRAIDAGRNGTVTELTVPGITYTILLTLGMV